ncbi:MAG: hypothetical protein JRM74_04710 [Nitrososphaerota archaeon]|nr:hypothetical protein [Nitrososphaerota archaeon]
MSHRSRRRPLRYGPKLAALLALALLSLTGFANGLTFVTFASSGGSNPYATITTQLPSVLNYAKDVGLTSPTANMNVSFVLPAANVKQLDQFLGEMNTPGSPYYHKYLTAQQYDSLFGPDAGELAQLQSYLAQYGITVTTGGQVSPGSASLTPDQFVLLAHGSVSEFEQALRTQVQDYQYNGANFYSASSQAQLPNQFGNLLMIYGLDNWQSSGQAHGAVPLYRTLYQSYLNPNQTPGNFFAYSPSEIAQSYNLSSLYSRNINGSGVTIAIVDAYGDPYIQDELNNFSQQFGIPTTSVNTICVDGPCNMTMGIVTGWNVEIALDVEWAHALAPGAKINLYIGSNNAQALFDAEEAAVNSYGSATPNNIISNSWGIPENDIASSASVQPVFGQNYPWLDQVMQQAAAQGITVFAASGDWGAYDQSFGQTSPYGGAVYPSTDPYVTGVGGTTLYMQTQSGYLAPPYMNATGGYGSETAWSWNNVYGWGTGGGYSTLFSQPAWQSGPGVATNGARGAPDVAWVADVQTGVAVDVYDPSQCGGMCGYIIGGTSVGSPSWAASMALIDQAAGGPLGYINPTLYSILNNSTQYAKGFHDVTSGDNNPYQAGPGWDPLTGLGSPNVGNLAAILAQDKSSKLSVQATLSLTGGSYGPSNSGVLVDESGGSTYDSLDPGSAFYLQDVGMLNALYQNLIELNGTSGNQFQPILASSYNTSVNGGQTNTFQIRPNVTFSNGDKLSAYDQWFSIVRTLYMNAPSGIAPFNWNQVLYNLTLIGPSNSTKSVEYSDSYCWSADNLGLPAGLADAIEHVTGLNTNSTTLASCQLASRAVGQMLSNFNPSNATQAAIMAYPGQAVVAPNASSFVANYLHPMNSLEAFGLELWSGFDGQQVIDPAQVDANGGVSQNALNSYINSNGAIGSGPYEIQSIGAGLSPVVFVATPGYWANNVTGIGSDAQPAKIPKVVYQVPGTSSQLISDFGTNVAQLSSIGTSQWQSMYNGFGESAAFSFSQILRNAGQFPFTSWLLMNQVQAPTNITDFRRGLFYAINYTSMLQPSFFDGTAYDTYYVPPLTAASGAFYNPNNLPLPAQNTALAFQFFNSAGLQGKFYTKVPTTFTLSNGTVVNAGTVIGDASGTALGPVLLSYSPPLSPIFGQEMASVSSGVSAFGINLTLYQNPNLGSDLGSPATFPTITSLGWGPDFQDPFLAMFQPLLTPSPYNGWFNNATVSSEVNSCLFTTTVTQANTCDSAMINMTMDNMVFIPTPDQNYFYYFVQPYVQGFVDNPYVGYWYNQINYSPVPIPTTSIGVGSSLTGGQTVQVSASVKTPLGAVVSSGSVNATVTTADGASIYPVIPLAFNATSSLWTGSFQVNNSGGAGEWTVAIDAAGGGLNGQGYATVPVGDGVTIFSPLSPFWAPGDNIPVRAVITTPSGADVTSGSFSATFASLTPSGQSQGSVPLSYQCGLNTTYGISCMWVGNFNVPTGATQGPWIVTIGGTDASGNRGSAYTWLNVGLNPMVSTDNPTYVLGDSITIMAATGSLGGNFTAAVSDGGTLLGNVRLSFNFISGLWSGTFQTSSSMPSGFYTVTVSGDTGTGFSGSTSTVVRVAPYAMTVIASSSVSSLTVTAGTQQANQPMLSAKLFFPDGTAATTGSVVAYGTIGLGGAGITSYQTVLTYNSAAQAFESPSNLPGTPAQMPLIGSYGYSVQSFTPGGDYGSNQTGFFVSATPHAAISITSPGDFNSTNGVLFGNGTTVNPFVIGGLNVSSITISGSFNSSYVLADNWVQGSAGAGLTLDTPNTLGAGLVANYMVSNAGDGLSTINTPAFVAYSLSAGNGGDGFSFSNSTGFLAGQDVSFGNVGNGYSVEGSALNAFITNSGSFNNGANGFYLQNPQAAGAGVMGNFAGGNREAGFNVTGPVSGAVSLYFNSAVQNAVGIAVSGQGQSLAGPFPCPVTNCFGVYLVGNTLMSNGIGVLATDNAVVISEFDTAGGNGVGFEGNSSVVGIVGALTFNNPSGGISLNQQAPGNLLLPLQALTGNSICNCTFTSIVTMSSSYFDGNRSSGTGPGYSYSGENGVLSFDNLAAFGGSDGFRLDNVNSSLIVLDTSTASNANGFAFNGFQADKIARDYAGPVGFGYCQFICTGPTLQSPGNAKDGLMLYSPSPPSGFSGYNDFIGGVVAMANGNNGIQFLGSSMTNIVNGSATVKNFNDGILVSGPGGNDTIANGVSNANGMNGIELAGQTHINKVNNYNIGGNGWACSSASGCSGAAGVYITDSSNNTVSGGSIGGTSSPSSAIAFGVAINGTLSAGNQILNSNIQDSVAGVGFIDTANNTASGNYISNNEVCIYLQNGANNNYANNKCNNNQVNVYSYPALDQSFAVAGTPSVVNVAGSNYLNVTLTSDLLFKFQGVVFFEVDNATSGQEIQVVAVSLSLHPFESGSVFLLVQTLAPGTYKITSFTTTLADVVISPTSTTTVTIP